MINYNERLKELTKESEFISKTFEVYQRIAEEHINRLNLIKQEIDFINSMRAKS